MKILTLSLKKQWFDKIKSGEKKEEYRELKEYWKKRLFESNDISSDKWHLSKSFDRLVFSLGYPKAGDKERHLEFKNPRIRIGTGRPEWGAEPGKKYFTITWEE